jgi:transposase
VKKYSTVYVGLDEHKESISISIAPEDRSEPVRFLSTVPRQGGGFSRAVRRLERQADSLVFAYEAGPCGYVTYRYLRKRGHECLVVAPSKIPRRPGDRVKTDRRDSGQLARLLRSGDLRGIYVPGEQDEVLRDLCRARYCSSVNLRRAKTRLKLFLLRHGEHYQGNSGWTKAYRRWLSDRRFSDVAQQAVFQEYVDEIGVLEDRVHRLESHLKERVKGWWLNPVVEALQGLRGVGFVIAVTVVSELGDIRRFRRGRDVAAFLGLTPSEHSTGGRRRLGGITKCGNRHVRRSLVEASWSYRYPQRVSRALLDRQEGLPHRVVDLSWKAQDRLCRRYRRLVGRGKLKNVAITAVARELACFMWSIGCEVLAEAA